MFFLLAIHQSAEERGGHFIMYKITTKSKIRINEKDSFKFLVCSRHFAGIIFSSHACIFLPAKGSYYATSTGNNCYLFVHLIVIAYKVLIQHCPKLICNALFFPPITFVSDVSQCGSTN